MPPRSTKAPKSAMFLTTPLRSWPISSSLSSSDFFSLRLGFDQAATADDDVAAGVVDLQDHALDRLADVLANVVRTANVDLAGRQEDIHADVDQQTAFDLAGDFAADHVAFVDGLHDLHPLLDLLSLALAEDDHATIVVVTLGIFDIFDQHANLLAGFWLFFFLFPLVASDRSFALVAYIDEHKFVIDADDGAFYDLIDVYVLGLQPRSIVLGHQADFCFPLILRNVKFTN